MAFNDTLKSFGNQFLLMNSYTRPFLSDTGMFLRKNGSLLVLIEVKRGSDYVKQRIDLAEIRKVASNRNRFSVDVYTLYSHIKSVLALKISSCSKDGLFVSTS